MSFPDSRVSKLFMAHAFARNIYSFNVIQMFSKNLVKTVVLELKDATSERISSHGVAARLLVLEGSDWMGKFLFMLF